MDAEQRAEAFRKHPDTEKVLLAGKERHFFFGRQTFKLAEKHGIDLGGIIKAKEGDGEDEDPSFEKIVENIDTAVDMAWLGCRPCDPDLEREEVEMLLSFQDARRLQEVLQDKDASEAPPSARPGPPEGK